MRTRSEMAGIHVGESPAALAPRGPLRRNRAGPTHYDVPCFDSNVVVAGTDDGPGPGRGTGGTAAGTGAAWRE